ncbi:DUF2971 domain-containing protein [Vibrio agarivorans]|uniref:DUF2971 domain-containing protein n=1 Tax=Vibrio agarivorans TaxID=153622 RepID=UPI0025B61594|nr:DUF2971 domain-containing protein [Vibrio agarivorans]MDN3663146.1 DUF2971 domain-containing protein [Vibrio agarivorans]
MPVELFKYRAFDKYTILNLLNQTVWLPKVEQLNDPFDGQFKLTDAAPDIDTFIDHCAKFSEWFGQNEGLTINIENIRKEMFLPDGTPNDELREYAHSFKDFFESKCKDTGVLSLSSTAENTTMWSHYGDEHTGICIGYDPSKLFNKSYGNGLPWLREVKYLDESQISRNSYLLYAESGFGSSSAATKEFFKRMLSVKVSDWTYEKEWRFILPECGGQVYSINKNAITSITFGLRTTIDSKHALVNLIRNLGIHPKTYQIIRNAETLGLERVSLESKPEYWKMVGEE